MNPFKLLKITLAATNVKQMVNFYTTVFNCNFKVIEAYGTKLYSAEFMGINLLICPNEIAGVTAQQNRQQFDIVVSKIEEMTTKVIAANGTVNGAITENNQQKIASITDPDGNTMVFIENLSNK